MPVVVSNASPLIILAKAELLDILRDQFGTIFVPQAVIEEILAGPPDDVMASQLRGQTWVKTVSLDPPLTPLAYWRLGRGEAEVIEYARLHPGTPALLDDRSARRAAKALGIPVYGTLSIIAKGVARGTSYSFDEAVLLLRKAGLYVDDNVVAAVQKGLHRGKTADQP